MPFRNLSIRAKLTLSFIFLILMALVTNGFNASGMLTTKSRWSVAQEAENTHVSLLQREVEHLRR